MVHPQAIISEQANIGQNVSIGAFTIIEENVSVGDGCQIANNVVIKKNTQLGKNNIVHTGAILGGEPQDYSQKDVDSELIIGDNNTFRAYVTINRGSSKQDRLTKVGSDNYFMINAHVGHDCVVGDHVTMVNGAVLGGHVTVDNYAIIGAFCAIHQFCQVGAYAMVTHAAMVIKDVLPFLMVSENKPKVVGLNKVGLRRNGFTRDDIQGLMRAYKVIFASGMLTNEVLTELEAMVVECAPVQKFIDGLRDLTEELFGEAFKKRAD